MRLLVRQVVCSVLTFFFKWLNWSKCASTVALCCAATSLILFPPFCGHAGALQASSNNGPDFKALTQNRLAAAGSATRTEWSKSVSTAAVFIGESGTPSNVEAFWKQEQQYCGKGNCSLSQFSVAEQDKVTSAIYILVVSAAGDENVVRCVDIYTLSSNTWRLISAIRTSIPNGRKMAVKLEDSILNSLVGKYADNAGQMIQITSNNGHLFGSRNPNGLQIELIPESATRFVVIGDTGYTEFAYSEKGEVKALIIHAKDGDQILKKVN